MDIVSEASMVRITRIALTAGSIVGLLATTLLWAQIQNVATVVYDSSDEDFPNPERGFYRQFLPLAVGTERREVSAAYFNRLRPDGLSLAKLTYVIDEFRTTPISPDALDAIRNSFEAVRRAGVKVVPRFAYAWPRPSLGEDRFSHPDTSVEHALAHIDQLTPLFRAYGDVIAYFELGFVGAWGEWHTSTSGLVNDGNGTSNANSRAIVDRILWALPANRSAVLRYPWHKQEMYGLTPLNVSEAYMETARARLGAYNDCFLVNRVGGNTYLPPFVGTAATRAEQDRAVVAIRAYLAIENKFLPQGGETCGGGGRPGTPVGPDTTVTCANALRDLGEHYWSAMSLDVDPGVLAYWDSEGCLPEIRRRLGYRFRLVDAELPARAIVEQPFVARIRLDNDGFAAPYNSRDVQLILRHTATGRIYSIPFDADPRTWGPNQPISIHVAVALPRSLDTGVYQFLLNLPDPDRELSRRPEYSIRLANRDVWEARTGYNDLKASVDVVAE